MTKPLNIHFLFFSTALLLSGFAPAQAQADLETQISRAEVILFGGVQSAPNTESRLETVERKLYGKPKHGPIAQRLHNVAELLQIDNAPSATSSSLPQPAPQFVRANNVATEEAVNQPTVLDQASEAERLSEVDKILHPSSSVTSTEPKSTLASPVLESSQMTATQSRADSVGTTPAKAVGEISTGHATGAIKSNTATLSGAAGAHKLPTPRTASTGKNAPAQKAAQGGTNELVQLKMQKAESDMPPLAPKIGSASHAIQPHSNSLDRGEPAPASSYNSKQTVANLLRQGLKLHAEGYQPQAEAVFREVLSVDPRNADAFFNLGSIAEARRDLITALTNYRAALNLNPSDHEFKEAVSSVESMLSKGGASTNQLNRNPAPTGGTNFANSPQNEVEIGHFKAPDYEAAVPVQGHGTPAAPFQLQSAQNDALLNVQSQYPPVMSVQQNLGMPTMNVSQRTTPVASVKQKSQFGLILSVGAGLALRNTPLHCPICHMISNF